MGEVSHVTGDQPLLEGSPSLPVALAIAAIGVVILAGICLAVLLLPDQLRPGHWVVGGIAGVLALSMVPWQVLDTRSRRHILTSRSLKYRCGILSRFEVEVPYRAIQAVTVRQGIVQRLFGCGDVRVSALGVSGPVTLSQQDMNSVCMRSITDFAEVAQLLRDRMNEESAGSRAVRPDGA